MLQVSKTSVINELQPMCLISRMDRCKIGITGSKIFFSVGLSSIQEVLSKS
jgi:hypothetical protein